MPFWKNEEEYVELDTIQDEPAAKKVSIQIEKIEEYADSDRIQRKVREGVVMLVNIKPLKDKNLPELRRAVDRIKRTCEAVGGDIVGAGDDWVLVSPANAKIMRNS